jgi:hypothetical protein
VARIGARCMEDAVAAVAQDGVAAHGGQGEAAARVGAAALEDAVEADARRGCEAAAAQEGAAAAATQGGRRDGKKEKIESSRLYID